MKSKAKITSLFLLSLIYPYLLIDLVLDETAPWNPILNSGRLMSSNWVAFLFLILLFSGILYLGKSVFNEKKDETKFILKTIYKNAIGFSFLIFSWVFSIFVFLLLRYTEISYLSILYVLFFPMMFSLFYYLFYVKKEKSTFSYDINIILLLLVVVLPVILYGLLSAMIL